MSDAEITLPLLEWSDLTPRQKEIMVLRFREPTITNAVLAKRVKATERDVEDTLAMDAYAKVARELAILAKAELLGDSVAALRDCLRSKNPNVKLAAALKVLGDAGIVHSEPRVIKNDKKISISWQGPMMPQMPAKVIDAPAED